MVNQCCKISYITPNSIVYAFSLPAGAQLVRGHEGIEKDGLVSMCIMSDLKASLVKLS